MEKQYSKVLTGNLSRAEGAAIFFINKEAKETVLDFSKGSV